MDYTSPLTADPAARRRASADLQDRIARVMDRVAADKTQTKTVRQANTRDAKTARAMARAMRES